MEEIPLHSLRHNLSQNLYKRKVFITGATGFVGRLIVREGLLLNDHYGSDIHFYLMQRHGGTELPNEMKSRDDVTIIESSFSMELDLPTCVDSVFHCATPASALLNTHSPLKMFELNVAGMKWLLEKLAGLETCPRVVFTSSGAVYGSQPENLKLIPENYFGAPNVIEKSSAYAEGKRVAEFLLAQAGYAGLVDPVITRLFAFSGIGLPLTKHFAIGNFVFDAVHSGIITVRGTGRAVRSYLDSRDLGVWMWCALANARSFEPINIGSEKFISIGELAKLVAMRAELKLNKSIEIETLNESSNIDGFNRYVPSTEFARSVLNVGEWKSLDSSIDEMLDYALLDQ